MQTQAFVRFREKLLDNCGRIIVGKDQVIEQLAVEARHQGRDTTVATSDNTVRATIGGVPVKSLSSALISHEFGLVDHEVAVAAADRSHHHTTLGDRLAPEVRARLEALRKG